MELNNFNTTQMDSRTRLRNLYLLPGDVIAGNYEYVRELGHGNMGRVYLCRDTVANDRLMAVKTVPDILRDDDEAVAALKREYDNMYSLTDDGIVAVRHLVMDDFRYYVVMDYAEGETLAAYLAKHRKPGDSVAFAVVRRLAAALDYAHGPGHGLVHRDVKPGNVMVQIDGNNVKSVKLLDFGLGLQIRKSFSRTTGQLTSGTPAYKSPEQWDPHRYGKPSFNSDQYSLAAIAYELLSGDYPFAEYDDMDTFRAAVLNDMPEKINGIANYVNEALQKALAKKPEKRFDCCMAFADALQKRQTDGHSTTLESRSFIRLFSRLFGGANPQPQPQPQPSNTDSPRRPPVVKTPPPPSKPQPRPADIEPPRRPTIVKKTPLAVEVKAPARPHVEASPRPEPMVGKDGLTFTLPGGIPLELVHISAGSFMMGSPESEQGRYDNETQHHVTLTKDYWLGRCPVTQEQYQAITRKNPSSFKGATRPVEGVSWNDAKDCCDLLNKALRAKLPSGYVFDLPTEAQWEYACRAGTTTPFSFGSTLNGDKANCDGNYPYGMKQKGKYLQCTSKIGSYGANPWGVYDMHGNVWEWCKDWYGAYLIDAVCDPKGASSGSGRVIRGGAWNYDAWCCRSARRYSSIPAYRGDDDGFRVALVPVQ